MIDLTVDLGGVAVGLSLAYDNYKYIFEPLATGSAPQTFAFLPEDELHRVMPCYPGAPNEGYVESMELCRLCCDALLPFERAVFHALSFMWRGKAWLLTAPSGTGKSTQAELWRVHRGARVLNGDKAAVRLSGAPMAHGMPFSGTSGICENVSLPLRGVVVLSQAKENSVRRLGPSAAVAALGANVFADRSIAEEWSAALNLLLDLAASVPVYALACTPDERAVCALEEAMARERREV